MALTSDSWLTDFLLLGTMLLLTLFFSFKKVFSYWKVRNVPFQNLPLPFGFDLDILLGKKAHADRVFELYKKFEGERFYGYFHGKRPVLFIRDRDLIRRILATDFNHFEDRGLHVDEEHEPLRAGLINLKGKRWKSLRQKVTPTFSSSKLKGMFQQIASCGEAFLQIFENYAKPGEDIEVRSLAILFLTSVSASCAFGLQLDHDTEEAKMFREMVEKVTGGRTTFLKFFITFFFPKLGTLIGVRTIPPDVAEFFMKITKRTMEQRLKDNNKREDFCQLLQSLKDQDEKTQESDVQPQSHQDNSFKITDNTVAALSFMFLGAGSESTSSTFSIVLHYLAQCPEVQKKLQEEIDSTLAENGYQWTYEALRDMTYLDLVIQEAQRIFPVAHIHMRECTTAYKVPDSDLVIEKGVMIQIPVIGIHKDPAYYDDPEVFNPDRFLKNNYKPSEIFSPFGYGPRMCIAKTFAILEVKMFVATIMSKYWMKSSTRTQTPLRYDPRTLNNRALGGIWMSFHRRQTVDNTL